MDEIRNRIIDRIEEYEGYNVETGAIEAIENDLKMIGYKIVDRSNCTNREGGTLLNNSYSGQYNYCVYEYNTTKGKYYGVTVFINFDVPLIGNYINIPVYGETRIIFDKGTVEG